MYLCCIHSDPPSKYRGKFKCKKILPAKPFFVEDKLRPLHTAAHMSMFKCRERPEMRLVRSRKGGQLEWCNGFKTKHPGRGSTVMQLRLSICQKS